MQPFLFARICNNEIHKSFPERLGTRNIGNQALSWHPQPLLLDETKGWGIPSFARRGTKNIIMGQASEVQGKARYGAALFIDFENEAALKNYVEHPVHKAVAAQMPSLLSEFLVSNYLS